MGARLLALLLVLSLASACSADASSSPSAPPSSPPSSPSTDHHALAMSCQGEGTPTVVLEAGLDTSGDTFAALADTLADTTRVCWSDRAGVGGSPALAADAPDPWPGSSADALAAELERSGEAAPYVVLGWSYGGMVAQAFATRHADLTAGLVLEDSSVPEQFTDPAWGDIAWVDGGREVDEATAVAELSDIDLGDLPLVVLTAEDLTGKLRLLWEGYQERLTDSSRDAVHARAVGAGHAIHESAPDQVTAAVLDVVEAVRAEASLGPCAGRYDDLGGHCLSPAGGYRR
jgi:pimeloyl-ACP methyl ester carboxylesterase